MLRAVLILLITPACLLAQGPGKRLAEPRLVDTPFGDFPLERVEPGARLRLTSASGRTIVQVARITDSTVDVFSTAGDSLPSLTFAQLRALRVVEVRASRLGRERAANIGLLVGTPIGALLGLVRHNNRSVPTDGARRPSMADDVASCAGVAAFLGWLTGSALITRPRWRPVTIP